jgi:hypothetical protein
MLIKTNKERIMAPNCLCNWKISLAIAKTSISLCPQKAFLHVLLKCQAQSTCRMKVLRHTSDLLTSLYSVSAI